MKLFIPTQLVVLLQDVPKLSEGHPVPDVFDIAHHEVLYEEVVCSARGGNDVWEVGELLDQDDTVITAGSESPSDGVGHEDGDEYRDGVGDLARHLEHNDRDGDSVRHSSSEGSGSYRGITARADVGDGWNGNTVIYLNIRGLISPEP